MGKALSFDELPSTEHAHEFVGAEHGDVPFSVILIHASPHAGPLLHRHPYAEVFVVESGTATLQLGEDDLIVNSGSIVVVPANVAHAFTNTGTSELRMTSIHGAADFDTEWLSGED